MGFTYLGCCESWHRQKRVLASPLEEVSEARADSITSSLESVCLASKEPRGHRNDRAPQECRFGAVC